MGGNGWESRLCVCAPPLPRKTRPQRCWDLISARRHGRKRVLLGKGWRGWCAPLNVLPEKREEPEQWSSSPPARPPLPRLSLVGTAAALLLPATLSQRLEPTANLRRRSLHLAEVRSVQSQISASGSGAGAPRGYKSAHVRRISAVAQ